MVDINELRRLAQVATPGPWHFWHGWVAAEIDKDGGIVIVERPTPSGGKYQARVDANFKFIAAANPQAILELLDRLEVAERDAAHQKALADSALRVAEGWEEKCNALRADKATLQQMTYSLKDRLEAAESEALEEARLNGMGSEREAALMAKLEAAEKERDALRDNNTALRARIEEMEKQESVATVIKEGDSRYWMSERLWTFPDGKYPLYALPGAQPELNLADPAVQKRLAAQWGYVPAGEQVVPVVKDERAAFREWFEGEQGVAYDGLWSFAKAAWLARAALEESK